MPTVLRCLQLSTAHVSKTTGAWLDRHGEMAAVYQYVTQEMPAVHMARHCYGWFVWVDDDPLDEWPADLRAVMKYAKRLGCQWIHFDRDAEKIPDLCAYQMLDV